MEPRTYQQPPIRKNVLLVDGDPQSLRIVDVSLRRAGFEVRTAPDGATALSLVERAAPDLVIADTDLAEIDGFELCRRVKASPAGAGIQFVFLARPTKASRLRSVEVGADDFLSKPVYVKEVVSRVGVLLQRGARTRLSSADPGAERVSGKLSDLSMIDLLQTIAANGRSGVVHLRSAAGARGEVYFRKGAVVDAEVGRLSGADAVYRLFSWSDGTFEVEWRNIRRRDTVSLAAPALLMEGMRRLDEWTRVLHDLPSLETVFEVDYRLLAERLADIPDEVNGVLRLFDGVRTFLQVIDDCGLPDLEALTIIGKLHVEGIIRDVNAKAAGEEPLGPELDGWLSESAGPFSGAAPDAGATSDRRTAPRVADKSGAHRRPTVPVPPLEEPPHESAAGELSERFADRLHAEGEIPAPHEPSAPAPRSDEPAVVIPFPTATPATRQTLVSPSGGPAAAVAGEITNGIAGPSAGASAAPPPGAAAPPPMAPRSTEPGLGTAAPSQVSVPRSTDPGLGPVPSASAPPSRTSAPYATERPSIHEEAPAARASSPHVPALPFSDSASRWMSEGDAIQSDRNRSDGADELGLPSRFRGLILVGVAVVVAAGAIIFIRTMRGNSAAEQAPAVATAPAAPAAPKPAPPPEEPALVPNSKIEPAPAAKPGPSPAPGAIAAAPAAAAPVPGPAPAGAPPEGAVPAVAETPEFAQLLSGCQEAFSAGRLKDAATICAAAKDADPGSARALSLLSHVEFNRNHRKDALAWAEKAIKIDPKLADAYVIIGGVQQDTGHVADAKAAYKKYLELAPKGQYASDLRAILETL